MSVTVLAAHRSPEGRFVKGCSGNPAGRPKGARNRATVLAETLEEAGPALLADATRRALGGDGVTLRALLHHLLPRPGDPTVELDLAPGAERDDEAVMDAVARAIADGAISPADGLRIGRFVALRARLRERALRLRLRAAREAGRTARAPSGKTEARPVSDLYFSRKTVSNAEKEAAAAGADAAAKGAAPRAPAGRPPEGEAVPPVSDLYFSARSLSAARRGGSGRPADDAARKMARPPLRARPETAQEAARPPVPALYFARGNAPRGALSRLLSTTALAGGVGAAGLRSPAASAI
ncbi:MAG: hypothetical protein IRZ04_14590 [Rhodospirillales bacterium]|nr:hypothetical protein [Rhodospirillales bacterium]